MVAIMAVVYVFVSGFNKIFARFAITLLIVLCQTGTDVDTDLVPEELGAIGRCDYTVNCTVRPCSFVYNASPTLLWARTAGVPLRPRPQRSFLTSFVAYLLLTVETNPGPFSSIRFGSFNVGGGNKAGAGIQDLIRDHQLQVLAVSETWIREDAPDAVKVDMAPAGFGIMHEIGRAHV